MNTVTHVFTFKPSYQLLFTLLVSHGAVVLSLLFTPLPRWSQVILCLILLASMIYYALKDALMRLPSAWVSLRYEAVGVTLVKRNQEKVCARILSSSFVSPLLIVLNFKSDQSRLSERFVLLPDSLSFEDFAMLRRLLKWRVAPTH